VVAAAQVEEVAVLEPLVVMAAEEAWAVGQEPSVAAADMAAGMAVDMAAVSLPVTAMGLRAAATQSALVAGQPSRHLAASIAPIPQRDGSPLRRRDGRIPKVG
jgi:hypothetical protein